MASDMGLKLDLSGMQTNGSAKFALKKSLKKQVKEIPTVSKVSKSNSKIKIGTGKNKKQYQYYGAKIRGGQGHVRFATSQKKKYAIKTTSISAKAYHRSVEAAVLKHKMLTRLTSQESKYLTTVYGWGIKKSDQTGQYMEFYTVMKKYDQSLGDKLRSGGDISVKKVSKVLKNGLKELAKAGVSHGDLQLENVLLDKKGTARISDFDSAEELNGYTSKKDCINAAFIILQLIEGKQIRISADSVNDQKTMIENYIRDHADTEESNLLQEIIEQWPDTLLHDAEVSRSGSDSDSESGSSTRSSDASSRSSSDSSSDDNWSNSGSYS